MRPDDDNQCPLITATQMTIDNANGDCCPHTTFASVNEHFRVNTKLQDLLFVCPGILLSLDQHVGHELNLKVSI